MAARHIVLATVFSLTTAVFVAPAALRAEDAAPADVDARHDLAGVINAASVVVRSGPREDAYPTMQLDKGAQVTVVGMKFNWLKIAPPEGSFAYVPKVYIQRRGDGSVGRASRELTAKVGSTMNLMKIAPMANVNEGDDVTIIGEQDEYFKVKPPAGSVLYVNKQFVDFLKVLPKAAPDNVPLTADKTNPGPTADHTARADSPAGVGEPATGPSTRPAGEAIAPTTAPSEVATAEFDALEAQYAATADKPITEQPLEGLLTGYDTILKEDALPNSMRRVAQARLATLKLRDEARHDFLATKASQDKMKDRTKALVAEREEIEERIKSNNIDVYAALGTLRASSVQHAGSTLYRLTDPPTGRTVAYVRTTDPKYASMIGQFVGVRGSLSTDSALNMKIIDSPTLVEPVDPAKVNTSIAAQLVPPSLLPKAASTGGGAPE